MLRPCCHRSPSDTFQHLCRSSDSVRDKLAQRTQLVLLGLEPPVCQLLGRVLFFYDPHIVIIHVWRYRDVCQWYGQITTAKLQYLYDHPDFHCFKLFHSVSSLMLSWVLYSSCNGQDSSGDSWELGLNSCLFLSCCVFSSHFSHSSKQYWPQGHPLTNIQWIAVKRNRLRGWVLPLNNHRHGDREVKQSSNCQRRQWSEKRGRERERDTEGKGSI